MGGKEVASTNKEKGLLVKKPMSKVTSKRKNPKKDSVKGLGLNLNQPERQESLGILVRELVLQRRLLHQLEKRKV